MSRWVTRRSILVSWKKEGTISNPFIYGLFQEKMVKKLRKNSIKKGFLHRVVHLLSFPVVPRAFLKCHTRKKSLDFLKNTKLFSTRWHLTLFKIVSKKSHFITFEDDPHNPLHRLTGFPLLATFKEPSVELILLFKLGEPQELLWCKVANEGALGRPPPTLREGPKIFWFWADGVDWWASSEVLTEGLKSFDLFL